MAIDSFAASVVAGLAAILLGCDSQTARERLLYFESVNSLRLVHEVPDTGGIALVEFDEISIDELRIVTLDDASRVMQVLSAMNRLTIFHLSPAQRRPPAALRFTPRYPLQAGLEYCVHIDRSVLGTSIEDVPV